MCFTILTPCLSAFVTYTIKVDSITDIRGAIAGNQNHFLFLLPCNKEERAYQKEQLKIIPKRETGGGVFSNLQKTW